MSKKLLLFGAVLFAMAAFTVPVLGQSLVISDNDSEVAITEAQEDNVYVAAPKFVLTNEVANDVVAAAGEVVLGGDVADNVYIIGGNILIDGDVGGDVFVIGVNVVVNGTIMGDLRILAGDAYINSSLVGGDIFVPISGKVSIASGVDRQGKLHLSGATIVQDATDNPTDLSTFPEIATFAGPEMRFDSVAPAFAGFLGIMAVVGSILYILFNIGLFIAGYGILRFFPVFTEQTLVTMEQKPWHAIGSGLLVGVLSPFIFIFLLFTIIGIPILGVLMLFAAVLATLGSVYANYLVGRLIMKKLGYKNTGRALPLFVGFVLVAIGHLIFGFIPVFGGLYSLILGSWGGGAIIYNKWQMIRGKELPKAKK